MKRILFVAPALLVIATLASPALEAQQGRGRGPRQNPCPAQGDQLRKRDGSCTTPGQGRGQGLRKQDGTGPRAGTEACPKTPKPAAK